MGKRTPPQISFDLETQKENPEQFLLDRAKKIQDCLGACPEFDHEKLLKVIYCKKNWKKEEFKKIDDLIRNLVK